ncbi:hypothetical protein [Pseudomonas sp. LFM046]|uniref:hypothetical protein n=1 Tax=Pseudomonas sp. LFM046 TaxID=1608357 RepID=UPI000AC2EF48|nr:hypothetical protein [Pseudomonas sp. LFM046]
MAIIKHLLLPLLMICCLLEFEVARAASDLPRHTPSVPEQTLSLPALQPSAG